MAVGANYFRRTWALDKLHRIEIFDFAAEFEWSAHEFCFLTGPFSLAPAFETGTYTTGGTRRMPTACVS